MLQAYLGYILLLIAICFLWVGASMVDKGIGFRGSEHDWISIVGGIAIIFLAMVMAVVGFNIPPV